jgi:hypothetical protein
MSYAYTKQTLLSSFKVDTPTANEVLAMIPSKGFNFLVLAIMAIIQTAGTQAAGTITLQTAQGTPVDKGTLVTGTSVADTSLRTSIAEDNREVSDGTGLQAVFSGTADTTLVAHVQIWGTIPFA